MENSWQTECITSNISANEVHIWRSSISFDEDLLSSYLKTLSNDEITRSNSFYFKKDKIRYITAKGILRNIIGRYTQLKSETIEFVYNRFGKPYLITNQNSQKLYFNIAHSHDYVVYAFTKNIDIGVDLELCQDISDLEEVAEYFFSCDEYLYLQTLSDKKKQDYFYKIWTLKEAFVKATGLGLSYDLRQISIEYLQNNNCKVSLGNDKKMHYKWTLQTFLSYENYSSAFATNQRINNVLFLNLD